MPVSVKARGRMETGRARRPVWFHAQGNSMQRSRPGSAAARSVRPGAHCGMIRRVECADIGRIHIRTGRSLENALLIHRSTQREITGLCRLAVVGRCVDGAILLDHDTAATGVATRCRGTVSRRPGSGISSDQGGGSRTDIARLAHSAGVHDGTAARRCADDDRRPTAIARRKRVASGTGSGADGRGAGLTGRGVCCRDIDT